MLWLALLLGSQPLQDLPATYMSGDLARSAEWCVYEDARRDAVANIERERRYARIGGVLNLSNVERWQRIAGRCEDVQRKAERGLKNRGHRRLRCDHPSVLKITNCYELGSAGNVSLVRRWSSAPECGLEYLRPYRQAFGI